MQKANVSFDFEGRIVKIQCSTDDKMKDICQKYANKIERNVNSLIFLYGGSNLNYQLSFKEQANIIDKERNEMSVLVYKNENDLSCPKCGEKINLNSDKINDIKTSINNISDTIKGLKFSIENIIKISSEEAVKFQLKNMNLLFNNVNKDIKKLNKKIDDLLNVTNINKELNVDIKNINDKINNILSNNIIKNDNINNNNYIIAKIEIKEQDVKKNIRILNSYEESMRSWNIKDIKNEYKNEEQIKKCQIQINDQIIPFNYFYQFKSKGKYTIKYSFNNDITNIAYVFCECSKLIDINLSNFNTNNVTDMRYMFYKCSSLTIINLSNFNTNHVTNMRGMFDGCSKLRKENVITKDKKILNELN